MSIVDNTAELRDEVERLKAFMALSTACIEELEDEVEWLSAKAALADERGTALVRMVESAKRAGLENVIGPEEAAWLARWEALR